MSYLAPIRSRNLAFGVFSLIERASAFLGPLVWGLVATSFIAYGPDRYRFAMLAMTLFVMLALWVLSRVRSDRV